MKKLIALLLALVMVLGLVACGNAPAADAPAADAPAADAPAADAPAADAPAADAENVKISIMWPETDSTQVDVMENYLQPALAEKFPNVEFEYIPMTDLTVTKTLSASGDLPDIWYTGGASIDPLVAAGDCLDLAQYIDAAWMDEHYKNSSLMYCGDAIYFLCPGQNAYYSPSIYYNTEIFAANNIAEPTNIDEFVAACKTLLAAGITPITSDSYTPSAGLLEGFIIAYDAEAYKELCAGTIDWTDERIKTALGYFDELKTMGAFDADIATNDGATAFAKFQAGNAAMMMDYSWMHSQYADGAAGFEVGYMPIVPYAADDYIQLLYEPRLGLGGGYTANANSENPELLAEIMMVIVDAESTRHNNAGVFTNFKVANPAQAPNALEAERFADYDRAESQISILAQGYMDGPTLAEWNTLISMLMSADKNYLSEQFIEELQPIWDLNAEVNK